jgi:hypothetical protein
MSAIVPTPTACTEAAAPPANILTATSIPMEVDNALNRENTTNNANEAM